MKLISHRGNLNGRIPERENSPDYIKEALELGYDVEIDVWFIDDVYYLGHDEPQYIINVEFLKNEKFWCHAKDIQTLYQMLLEENIHCFFHQEDDITLTSKNILWTFPGKELTTSSICVMPEKQNLGNILGVCSDSIIEY